MKAGSGHDKISEQQAPDIATKAASPSYLYGSRFWRYQLLYPTLVIGSGSGRPHKERHR